jgi:hypothetical protein
MLFSSDWKRENRWASQEGTMMAVDRENTAYCSKSIYHDVEREGKSKNVVK